MVERRRVGDTRSKVFQIPQKPKSLEHRGGTVRLNLASGGVDTVVLNVTGESVWGDQESGHTATVAVVGESVVLAVLGCLGVGLVVGADSSGGGDVVEETTRLIVGQKEERLFPLRTVAHSLVDLLDEDLAVGDVTVGVHGVGVGTAARGVEVGQLGELTQVSILEEVLDGDDAVGCVLGSPVEKQAVGEESTVGAVVVEPADVLGGGLLEDAVDFDGGDIKVVVVLSVAIGGTGNGTETVGVGRLICQLTHVDYQRQLTYSRNAREPVVEGGELVNQVDKDRDLLLGVVSQNLLSSKLRSDARVRDQLLVNEALLSGRDLAVSNIGIAGRILAKELKVVTSDRVVRVVGNRVEVLVAGAPLLAVGLADVLGDTVVPVVGRVVDAATTDTTKDVVEGAVLEQDPDDVLDLLLHVGDGLLGAGLVAKGSGRLLVDRLIASPVGVSGGRSGQSRAGQKANNGGSSNTGLHGELGTSRDLESSMLWQ